MTYTIKTYRDGRLIGQCTAKNDTLTLAEREAVILAESSGEMVEDVFYPPGESRVESVRIVGETAIYHAVRIVVPSN